MIDVTRHDDVVRLRMWTRRSRAVGYDVSAYLVRGILVDTGFRHARIELERALSELRPRGVIVTHWHEDHAGNAPTLAKSFPVWMSSYTEARLREQKQVKLYRRVVWGRPNPLVGSIEAFDPDPFEVVPTPGHSADHHVVYDAASETVFSADLWLGVKVRVMGSTENPYEILTSLQRVIALRPKRMFDAHRGLVREPAVALQAKHDWLAETIAKIEARLARGESDREILRAVVGREELSAYVTQGEYSRRNLVRTVRAHGPFPAAAMQTDAAG